MSLPSHDFRMRVLSSLLTLALFAFSTPTVLGASWTFTDATVSVQSKGSGVGGARKERYKHSSHGQVMY